MTSAIEQPELPGLQPWRGPKADSNRNGQTGFGWPISTAYHHQQNMRGAGLTGRDDDFLLDRTRLYMDYRVTDNIRLFAKGWMQEVPMRTLAPRQIEVNQLDAQNLFADVMLFDSGSGKLTARGGRQELLLGSHGCFRRLTGEYTPQV